MIKVNWIYLGIIAITIGIWYGIFTIGLFPIACWLIVISAIIGLWLRLTGRA